MNEILLDTSVIIDFLRRKDKNNSLFYQLSQKKYALCASMITYAEMHAGKSVWTNTKALVEVTQIFTDITVLPLTKEISEKAGYFRSKFNLDLLDAIIAATGVLGGIEIATLNIKHFKKIKRLKLFKSRDN